MDAQKQQALTDAFQAGRKAAREGLGPSSALTQPKGSKRDFWEAGFFKEKKKIEQEEREWLNSPEYAEKCRRHRARLREMTEGSPRVQRIWEDLRSRGIV